MIEIAQNIVGRITEFKINTSMMSYLIIQSYSHFQIKLSSHFFLNHKYNTNDSTIYSSKRPQKGSLSPFISESLVFAVEKNLSEYIHFASFAQITTLSLLQQTDFSSRQKTTVCEKVSTNESKGFSLTDQSQMRSDNTSYPDGAVTALSMGIYEGCMILCNLRYKKLKEPY